MRPQKRVVTKMPLTEIWDDSGTLSGGRIRDLDQSGLRELVLSGSVQFVVADPGLKLNWIPAEECFDFWKTVRPRIADPSGMRDRLVKEMRLAGIDSIAAANHFLETRFLVEWEQRFTVQPRNARNAHRPVDGGQRLEEILSVRAARKVAQDCTVSWDGARWGVPREQVCAGLRGADVEIERRLDGSHWLRFRKRYLRLRHCPDPTPRFASPSGLRPAGPTKQKAQPPKEFKPKWHVPQTHPWRKPWKRTFLLCGKEDISTLR
jgi:hypothetical protein